MKKYKIFIAFTMLACTPLVNAADHTVKLLMSGKDGQSMVMEPGYIKIAKGDSITFSPADPTHNAQSFSIPSGAKVFATAMGKTEKVTFDTEGVYLYKCLPHTIMGMLGVVQVGKAVNLVQAKADATAINSTVVMNKERLESYIGQIK